MLSLGLLLKMSMRNCVIIHYLFWPFQGSSSRSDAFARMQGHPSRYQRPKCVNDRQCWGQIGWFWRKRPAGSNDRSSQHFYWHPILDGSRGKFCCFTVSTTDGAGVAVVAMVSKTHNNQASRGHLNHFPVRIFVIVMVWIFFHHFSSIKPKHFLRFHWSIWLVSRPLCRRYIV